MFSFQLGGTKFKKTLKFLGELYKNSNFSPNPHPDNYFSSMHSYPHHHKQKDKSTQKKFNNKLLANECWQGLSFIFNIKGTGSREDLKLPSEMWSKSVSEVITFVYLICSTNLYKRFSEILKSLSFGDSRHKYYSSVIRAKSTTKLFDNR